MRLGYRGLLLGAALTIGFTALVPFAHADPIGYTYYFSTPLNKSLEGGYPGLWSGISSPEVTGYITLSAEIPGDSQDEIGYQTSGGGGLPFTVSLDNDTGPAGSHPSVPSSISILDYSFSTGLDTYTPTDSVVLGTVTIDNTLGSIEIQLPLALDSSNYSDTLLVWAGGHTTAFETSGSVQTELESTSDGTLSGPVPVVAPEPSSWTLLGTGALALCFMVFAADRRRRPAALRS